MAEPELIALAAARGDDEQQPTDQSVALPAEAPSPAQLPMLLESLLFVASEPVPIVRLAQLLEVSQEAIEIALADLSVACKNGGRGIRLQRKGDRVQLTTAPEATPYIEQFLGLDVSSKLSPAALETLSVIAYKQPLTRAAIEAVRGVNCDGVLRTLIEPVGRLEQPGRPFLYGTTERFLQYLGLESLADLPPLPAEDV